MFLKQLIYRSSDIMKFSIHLGIPEILALWTRLKNQMLKAQYQSQTLNSIKNEVKP